MRLTDSQEDRLIRRMRTLTKYVDGARFYRLNRELDPKVKQQLYSIIDQCHDLKNINKIKVGDL